MAKHFRGGYALIIGVANYPRVNKLSAAVLKDARDVADLLRSEDYCGYDPSNVELLIDGLATADGIRHGLRRLAETTGPEDTAVVFFSGHGGRVEGGSDAGAYLIPFDCEPLRLKDTALGSEELTALISGVRAGRLIVLLDACHSAGAGELKALDPLDGIKAGFDKATYDALAAGTGRVIMASSRSSEVSLILHGMPNSLFTYYLLEALRGETVDHEGDVVRVFDVFHYISDRVPARAEAERAIQHPIFKAQDVDSNFPLALRQGGKLARGPARTMVPVVRPMALSPKARIAIKRGLVRRWDDLADYFGIPLEDKARFQQGFEPQRVLEWLEERGRLRELRDAFNYLGYDDLIGVINAYP